MTSASNTGLQGLDGDARMETSFRKLLVAMESEREQIRRTMQQIEQERDITNAELDRLKQDAEDWCAGEKNKVDSEWKRLDKLSETMRCFMSDPDKPDMILNINCSGQAFTIPRNTLCALEDSHLAQMFSGAFIANIPRDAEGRLYVDFNPECFSIIVDYLRNRRLRPNAPVPIVPSKHQHSMEVLAEALQLKPFMWKNQISVVHGTSLYVTGNVIQAMHPGWQVISATSPLSLVRPSYFEVKILENPNTSGGLAIGVCGRIPSGDEVHSIRLSDSVLYNSHNGLVGDCIGDEDVEKSLQLCQGDVLGIRSDPSKRCILWYYNSRCVGTSIMKQDYVEKMRSMYPVFGLYAPDTKIEVDFEALAPAAEDVPRS